MVRQRSRLDQFEGPGYDARPVTVETSNGGRVAFVYVAKSAFIEPDLRPLGWYKAHVVNGSLEHGLPAWYRDRLRAVPVVSEGGDERAEAGGARFSVVPGKFTPGR